MEVVNSVCNAKTDQKQLKLVLIITNAQTKSEQ